MITAILRLVFIVLLVRTGVALTRLLFGRRMPGKSPTDPSVGGKSPAWKDLTPYDVDDADFEELPKDRQ